MNFRANNLAFALCVIILIGISNVSAQTEQRSAANSVQPNEIQKNLPANSIEFLASEIGQLRKSLQTLNKKLTELTGKPASETKTLSDVEAKQKTILLNFNILNLAEQRAEMLRKSLFDSIEQETKLKSRIVQIEEDLNPTNIERNSNLSGSTRTIEIREVRRRSLENERKGFNNLLSQIAQNRSLLEEAVREADQTISRLRQKLLPAIEKALE
ncbi:MAG: hypothetical protein H7Z37_07225 [Pyrinomonadaceae bacterium]|nr:hypothetical protein [Pyrinomonadaceae bacterium]